MFNPLTTCNRFPKKMNLLPPPYSPPHKNTIVQYARTGIHCEKIKRLRGR